MRVPKGSGRGPRRQLFFVRLRCWRARAGCERRFRPRLSEHRLSQGNLLRWLGSHLPSRVQDAVGLRPAADRLRWRHLRVSEWRSAVYRRRRLRRPLPEQRQLWRLRLGLRFRSILRRGPVQLPGGCAHVLRRRRLREHWERSRQLSGLRHQVRRRSIVRPGERLLLTGRRGLRCAEWNLLLRDSAPMRLDGHLLLERCEYL
jgi:hypothetical protein